MLQVLGTWSVLGWTLACFSMISIVFGAAEVEQQGLHFSSSRLLERHGLDSGLLLNNFQWLRGR